MRLIQPQSDRQPQSDNAARSRDDAPRDDSASAAGPNIYRASEFETFVRQRSGTDIRRFGSELVTGPVRTFSPSAAGLVPPDYVIGPGDELLINMWGSVEANLRLLVDRTGRINIPRVGTVTVVGVRFADIPQVLKQHVGQVFNNFQVSVTMGQLRGVRVYVTGFAERPGAYTVSSLSTLLSALMTSGGPSPEGSFRHIQLRRGSELVTTFDLYNLLLKGDKTADHIVQADDVIYVGPVGPQVGMIGSVNKPAVFELKPGETIADVLRMAGGFSTVADRTRLAAERLEDLHTTRVIQLALPQGLSQPATTGEILRAFSAVNINLPEEKQNKRVRVEGEVMRPGEYILPAGSSMNDAIAAAGGLTPLAYIYGTEFSRESTLRTQRENYARALRDLETDLTRKVLTQKAFTADETRAQELQSTTTSRLIERLRQIQPTGRVVLTVAPNSTELPALALENGDRLHIPSRPSSVGVFGAVFNASSFVFSAGRTVGDYLSLAGGFKREADERSAFVVRANGSVVSNLQTSGWFGMVGRFSNLQIEPGDTIFVPDELDRVTFMQMAREWTQILYQFGLGAAAIKVLRD